MLAPERFAEEGFATGFVVPDCFAVGWLAAGLLALAAVFVFADVLELGAGLPDLGCDVPRKLRVRPWRNWRSNIGAGVATSERTPTIDGIFFFGAAAE